MTTDQARLAKIIQEIRDDDRYSWPPDPDDLASELMKRGVLPPPDPAAICGERLHSYVCRQPLGHDGDHTGEREEAAVWGTGWNQIVRSLDEYRRGKCQ